MNKYLIIFFIYEFKYVFCQNKKLQKYKKKENKKDLIVNKKILTTNNTKLYFILISLNSSFKYL